ncbi:heat shock protein DnaJ [Musa troglodytarum]|uniref:Heat shock protein DnaJ n=1 Tax=Musa troglodytarum TaxID=320322 RepID=A0A9E7IET9_9LILI|nr:heat shock protein DnaJ [Musa troglodytarum]
MGGIDLFKQGCVWVQFQKQDFVSDRVAASHAVEKLTTLIDRHWPLVAVALEGLCRERLGVPLYLGYNSAIRHFVELPRLLDFDDFYCLCDSISDLTKKKNYDEQLRKEEHGREYQRPSVISQQMEIPRAFVCAESKVFDVSEWAICQAKPELPA